MLGEQGQSISEHGCPYGSLSAEVDKHLGAPDPNAARLVAIPIDWAEQQFRSMGRHDAPDLAVELISRFQGAALLTNALGNPALLSRQPRLIERWIDSLENREYPISCSLISPASKRRDCLSSGPRYSRRSALGQGTRLGSLMRTRRSPLGGSCG